MSPPDPGNPPAAEFTIDHALVRSLLAAQHPDLATFPLHLAAEGWDNVTFRLGERLAVRLPRREAAAALIENEQTWLPTLAPLLPLPIPSPIRIGGPSAEYPWGWSVVPWIAGTQALIDPLHPSEAGRLGGFLHDLHAIAIPDDPPQNPFRGVALSNRTAILEGRLLRMRREEGAIADAALSLLDEAAALSIDTTATWLHGDLHSKNVLSHEGLISAIIDWGDICTGDPATDLAAAWILFATEHQPAFWQQYGDVSDATLQRSRGWAISFGAMLWDSHHIADPGFAAAGLETINRAIANQ